MTAPLCTHLNAAVVAMAGRLFPTGFDVTDDEQAAPASLEALNEHLANTGRMLVWSGGSDKTIFGAPEINHAFRAWHDWCHWHLQAEFNDKGEYAVYVQQCAHLNQFWPGHFKLGSWMTLLYIEVVEQNSHYRKTGQFPVDQRAFVDSRLLAYRHVDFNPLLQPAA